MNEKLGEPQPDRPQSLRKHAERDRAKAREERAALAEDQPADD